MRHLKLNYNDKSDIFGNDSRQLKKIILHKKKFDFTVQSNVELEQTTIFII